MFIPRAIIAFASLAYAQAATAQVELPPPETSGEIEKDGTVVVGSFRLPPSVYLSEEAAASLPREASDPQAMLSLILNAPDPAAIRPMAGRSMVPMHEMMRQTYGVTTEAGEIAGVPVMWAIPTGESAGSNSDKVMINFPGGGFVAGTADGTGMTESIPVAGLAGVRVVSISYRQAPEHRFPAASEDSAAVYRALLESYAPENIAIFGCSAGGALAAQSIAWYVQEGLPLPAAVGIFCASADRFRGGDSMHYARPFQGLAQQDGVAPISYFDGSERTNPLVSPVEDADLMAQFPPSLIITATRAMEMSSAINTHRELVKAGVEADLHVWDGLGHAFYYDPTLPESREAYQVMADFFAEHLGVVE
ncbi:alpha/beta hydrolase fold domain-containing protein [Erythrobacter alti]|uniref:alpha/beta hydrolase fold domain-containing protein n=1 Tax=Erythrobacter alti TaxID=1896145 RepID=UPI0030F4288F